MAGQIVNRQMTQEEAKLRSYAAIVDLVGGIKDLLGNASLLKQLQTDAATSLKTMDDFSDQWDKAQSDISSANFLLHKLTTDNADLNKRKSDFETSMYADQTKFTANVSMLNEKLALRESNVAAREVTLQQAVDDLTIARNKLQVDQADLVAKGQLLSDAANKKISDMQLQIDNRNIELDKRENYLVEREKAVIAVKTALSK